MVIWRRREEIVGKEVIDGEAKKIGTTKDLAWTDDGKLALIVERGDDAEVFLAFTEVDTIGDVVFVKTKYSVELVPSVVCPVCKNKNPSEAKFCAKCGRTLDVKEEKKSKKDLN